MFESSPRSSFRQKKRYRPTQLREAYAALDLGTNNCRLLIAQPKDAHFEVVDSFSRIVRLGEGLGNSNQLHEHAISRTMEALQICSEKLAAYPIKKARYVATAACRHAHNGPQFIEMVKQKIGIPLEIIDQKTEAYLAAEGCLPLMHPSAPYALLYDIGGGSSEIVMLGRGANGKAKVLHWTSIPMGVVTLAEQWNHVRVDTFPHLFESMVEETKQILLDSPEIQAMRFLPISSHFHHIGTSGTVTILASLFLRLRRYDRKLVDGIWMRETNLIHTIRQLRAMPPLARHEHACIGPGRSDLVLAGAAILQALLHLFPTPWMRVADRGIREGILLQLMAEPASSNLS